MLEQLKARESLSRINELALALGDSKDQQLKDMRRDLEEAANRYAEEPVNRVLDLSKMEPNMRKFYLASIGLPEAD